ncbi:hypothetical protein ACQYAD_16645 [Neobacillus sp. SM06]|uniref:YqgU-like beta propeller domain-containing protein n=1 Tax=Neobacillus sp. SM06 TaxID=3422492 RepID=UPI003D2E2FC7
MFQPFLKGIKGMGAWIFLLVLLFFLSACSTQQGTKSQPGKQQQGSQQPKDTSTGSSNRWKIPMAVSNGEFFKGVGWLTNDTVLYITNQGQTSSVYRYHFPTGKSEIVYKSDYPIVTAQISPGKKYLLIHSSPSTYKGTITVTDLKGHVVWSESIPSYELSFEWNPYNESEVLISKFNEDWTFQVFLVSLETRSIKQLSVPQPFLKWIDKGHVAYLNSDQANPALFAPLVVKSLADQSVHPVFSNIYQFAAFKERVMTITVKGQDQSQAVYTFFDQKNRQLAAFSMPQLSQYSDWLVPFYDYIGAKDQFLTFQPVKSGEADAYNDGFELVSRLLTEKKSAVLFQNLKNEPLSCSPSGETCLYGSSLEKLMDLKAKKIVKWANG